MKPPLKEKSTEKAKPRVSARAKLLSMLSRREHAASELKAKMLRLGYEPTDIQEALTWAQSLKYQSDDRFAQSLWRRRAATHGNRAIEAEMQVMGVLEAWTSPHSTDPTDEPELVDEAERAFLWLNKRYSSQALALSEQEDKQQAWLALKVKAFQALTRKGFEIRNIKDAWKRFVVELNSDQ